MSAPPDQQVVPTSDDPASDDPTSRLDGVAAGAVGVVLAAGRGERFGATKQLALLAGEPLVAHAVRSVAAADLPVVVVTGADPIVAPSADPGADSDAGPDSDPGGDAERVAAAVRAVVSDATVVANPDPDRGMGSSLAVAARAVGPRDLVVVLADQPGVPTVDLRRVVTALADGATAVRTTFSDGGAGHPVGFAAGLHDRLCGLHDEGAGRRLLQEVGATEVAVDHPRPPDVDTPADLEALAASWDAGPGEVAGEGAS